MSDTRTANLVRYVPRQAAEWDIRNPNDLWIGLDGTLVYVDISGFTALSEKLAARGKVGAEELTETLNYVFGEMLTVAYARSGRLLKFGGDALLLLFQTEDHPVQACSAAVEMQQALRGASSYRTSAGRLNLKMSVGIHSGTIHLFRLGTSHKELILTGPAASKTTEMEETATGGEILISGETRAAIGEAAAPKPKGEGWLLGWRKGRGEGPGWTKRLDVSPETLAQSVPGALRRHLSHGLTEPEHRIGTIGFIRFQGVDSMMDAHGPDAVAAALHELFAAVQGACEQERVTFLASDIDADGGKIILTAGVPATQEDDEGRVLRAVVDIRDSAPPFDLQIGVNRGYVFAGDVGTEYRSTYTVMGDPVNLAARLMAAAAPGEILTTADVLDPSHTLFATTAREPFKVKGKERPVQAYSLHEEIGERPQAVRDVMPFRGREPEVGRLAVAYTQAETGAGGVIAIRGDRGIGKTRLVEEFLKAAAPANLFSLRAEPYGTTTAYRTVRDPLRMMLGVERVEPTTMARQARAGVKRLRPDLLPLLPLLGDPLALDLEHTRESEAIEPRFRRERAADMVIALLDAAAEGKPLVVVAEDTHWVDDATGYLLERLGAAADDRRWLLIATRREVDGGFLPTGEPVELGPLSDEVAKSLVVDATESAPLRPHEVEQVVGRAAGNPLFLEEILTTVRATGSVGDLPETLDAVVSAQIDALPPLPRLLLRVASVLGRSFTPAVLSELVREMGIEPDQAAEEILQEFLGSDESGRMVFRHALVRDVAYEGLSFKRRRELHRIAGNAIERVLGRDHEGAAGPLAIHYSLGQQWDKAWRFCRLAGDLAREAYANVEAGEQYERALEAAKEAGVGEADRARVWTLLGDVDEAAGAFDEALSAYQQASRLLRAEPVARADVLAKKARALERSGRYPQALRAITEGHKLLEGRTTTDASSVRARLAALAATVRVAQQRDRDAIKQALVAAEAAKQAGELGSLARAYSVLDLSYRWLGEPEKAVYAEEALALYEQVNDLAGAAVVTSNLGVGAYFDGDWRAALDYYERGRDLFLRSGNAVQAALAEAAMGEILVNQHRVDEAEPLLLDALRVLRASDFTDGASFAEVQLGRVEAEKGDYGAARQRLEHARQSFSELGESASAVDATVHLAECHIRSGSPEAALRELDASLAGNGEEAAVHSPSLARMRAWALMELGRLQEAAALIEPALAEAEEQGLKYEVALLLALADDIDERRGEPVDSSARGRAETILGDLGVLATPRSLV